MNPPEPLEAAITSWDRAAGQEWNERAFAEIEQIRQQFALGDWATMPVERYALGTEDSKTSFCYALEFGTAHLGSVRGGSANKHLIYWRKNDDRWYYPDRYSNVEEAWESIRAGYVRALELATDGRLEEIDDIEALRGAPAMRQKAVWVYFPDLLIPIYSHAAVNHFLPLLDTETTEETGIRQNLRLRRAVDQHGGFEGWETTEIGHFLWKWSDPNAVEDKPGKHWLFQANPKVYDFGAALQEMTIGDGDDWSLTRYRASIKDGDRVVLWVAGDQAGAYALGTVTGEPFKRGEHEEHFTGDDESAIGWQLDAKIEPPIPKTQLTEHPVLKDLAVIKAPQGSNFRVTPDQWRALTSLVGGGERSAEPTAPSLVGWMAGVGLRVSEQTLRRYHVLLLTRRFVILSGLSGTGKTWLAEEYAHAVGAEFLLVPVAPNWTTNEDLLGHFNPLEQVFVHTDFSRFLTDAAAEYDEAEDRGRPARPFHLLLDEMNLARVEYYFAKFLSAMEIVARDGEATLTLGPGHSVQIHDNLFFVGTVNVDETTHGFADKVYDRAQLIELTITRGDLEAHLETSDHAEAILEVWDAVAGFKPFAYRVADEITAYVDVAVEAGGTIADALDEQILQKVLPRLSGADPRLETALNQLAAIATGIYPLTAAKTQRMLDDHTRHGFTSYF